MSRDGAAITVLAIVLGLILGFWIGVVLIFTGLIGWWWWGVALLIGIWFAFIGMLVDHAYDEYYRKRDKQ